MSINSINATNLYARAGVLNDNKVSEQRVESFFSSKKSFMDNLAHLNSVYAGEVINTSSGVKSSNKSQLFDIFSSSVKSIKEAENVNVEALQGKASPADVVSAIANAEIAMKELKQIYEKFMAALNEIRGMSI